tara:strand:+ start:477 stop:689 length:213 start_codon:yes stop_codon:yes gene_type:complete
MASSIVGLLITTIAFSGLVLSYQYVEESYRKAARYPLNKNELDILQSAGLNSEDNIQALNLDLKSMPQNQ